MPKTLVQELASAIQARKNCEESNNTVWNGKWAERIRELSKQLPHGSGIDGDCYVDQDASHADKLVIQTAFHHMDENGFYDGWTQHTVIVTPSFNGINIRITGQNRNDIKDYLYETFDYALTQPFEQ